MFFDTALLPVLIARSFRWSNRLVLLHPEKRIKHAHGHGYMLLSRRCVQSQTFRAKKRETERFSLFHRSISTFRYTSLDSSTTTQPFIRLLELLPGRDSHLVKAKLKEVALSENLRYEAVSYCWGDPEDLSSITCNGHELRVPRRLEVALRNMRYSDKPRLLWADAIYTEKESQVQLMRTIFSNAQRTLIWLGDVEEKQAQKMSKFAVWSIKMGLSIFRRRADNINGPQVPVWDMEKGRFRTLAPFSSEFYLELIGMLRMPWFQRAWVVQEVAMSPKAIVFWGSSQYDWDDVIRTLKFMSKANFPLAFIVTLENISTIDEEQNCTGGVTTNSMACF